MITGDETTKVIGIYEELKVTVFDFYNQHQVYLFNTKFKEILYFVGRAYHYGGNIARVLMLDMPLTIL